MRARLRHVLAACLLLSSVIVLAGGQQAEPQGSTHKHKQHSRHKPHNATHFYPQPPHRVPSPSPAPRPPPAPLPPPDCNCKTFPELSTRAGSCVNCTAGIPARLNVTTCRPLLTSFCKAVDTQWSCIYPYKRAGFRCSQRDGACDLDDICTGASPACVDRLLNQSFVCREPPGACVLPTLCDGVSHTCPSRKRLVRDGEPCVVEDGGSLPDGQAGPYTEVLDATGKVAVASAAKAGEAKEREWATCQRCFGGVCKAFKYEWMHKTADNGKQRHQRYAYDEDEAGYAASRKAGMATKRYSEFEPQFFCQREEGAGEDGDDG